MTIPNDEECQRIIKELKDEPSLSQWEANFLDSNRARLHFTDRQKEIFAELLRKYEVWQLH